MDDGRRGVPACQPVPLRPGRPPWTHRTAPPTAGRSTCGDRCSPAACGGSGATASTLQLGRCAGALVLPGVDEPLRRILALLDGTRDRGQLTADAWRAGCPPERTAELVGVLAEAGLLEDGADPVPALSREERDRLAPDVGALSLRSGGRPAPLLARRAAARVLVHGGGRVGAPLASALAAAGVGSVDVVDDGTARPQDAAVGGLRPGDAGRPRGEAARERLRTAAPSADDRPSPVPDLVVLAPVGPLPDALAPDLVRQGVPHLLAEVREQVGVVGPLVLPGRSACLHCLDLTRTDLDPGWPALAAQLSVPARGTAPCDGALALAVAAAAALQVLAALDQLAAPASLDGTLELASPDWRWRRRSWPPHPDCDCAAAGGSGR